MTSTVSLATGSNFVNIASTDQINFNTTTVNVNATANIGTTGTGNTTIGNGTGNVDTKNLRLIDPSNSSKIVQFSTIGKSAGTTSLAFTGGANTITFPANTDTLMGRDTVDTMTNKTLTAPVITGTISLQGPTSITDTTDSTTTGTGALTVAGGLGVAKNLNVGSNVTVGGNLTVNGTTTTVNSTTTTIADNMFIVNSGPTGTKDAGCLAQRFQSDNDTGAGDVVADTPDFTGTITALDGTRTILTFGATASAANGAYIGYCIKITSGALLNTVRKITAYDGTTKQATLSSAVSGTSSPTSGDTMSLYSRVYVGNYWDTVNRSWKFGYAPQDSTTTLTTTGVAPLQVGNIYVSGANMHTSTNGIQFNNGDLQRKVVLYSANDNAFQYMGLGQSTAQFDFQLPATTNDFAWFAGTSSTARSEVMRLKGNGTGGLSTVKGTFTGASNQLVLGSTNTTTLSAPAPASSITLSLPITADTLVGRNTTDTLTNKSLVDSTVSFVDNVDNTKKLAMEISGKTTNTTTLFSVSGGATTITFPSTTDTLIGRATTDTLSNKQLIDGLVTFVDDADFSRKLNFQLATKTIGTTTVFAVGGGATTITFPNVTETLVGRATTETLTNKTLTNPLIDTITGTTVNSTMTLKPTGNGKLETYASFHHLGADMEVDTRSTNTSKYQNIGMPHYSGVTQGVMTLSSVSDSTSNTINIGGGVKSASVYPITINDGNNKFVWYLLNNGTKTCTITNGRYTTGADLATALQTALSNPSEGGGGVWTIVYNATTDKLEFTTDNAWRLTSASTCYTTLGITEQPGSGLYTTTAWNGSGWRTQPQSPASPLNPYSYYNAATEVNVFTATDNVTPYGTNAVKVNSTSASFYPGSSTPTTIDGTNGLSTPSAKLTNTTNQMVLGTTNTTTLSAPAPASSIILTLPVTADTLVGRATVDTLSNKTLITPIIDAINSPDNASTTVIVNSDLEMAVGKQVITDAVSTDTITPKTTGGQLQIDSTGGITLGNAASTVDIPATIVLPNITASSVLGTNATNDMVAVSDINVNTATCSATTNQLVLGTTNTTTLNAPAPISPITVTLPTTTTTLVGTDTVDTLTNKTLSSPIIDAINSPDNVNTTLVINSDLEMAVGKQVITDAVVTDIITSKTATPMTIGGTGTTININTASTGPTNIGNSSSSVTVTGDTALVDALPLINSAPTATSHPGFVMKRYQVDNDTGSGDVVNGTYNFTWWFDVSSIDGTRTVITITSGSNTQFDSRATDFFKGWWLKGAFHTASSTFENQVRQIVSSTATSAFPNHLPISITLSSPLSGTDTTGSFVGYPYGYVASVYDEGTSGMKMVYSHTKDVTPPLPTATNPNGDFYCPVHTSKIDSGIFTLELNTDNPSTVGDIYLGNESNSVVIPATIQLPNIGANTVLGTDASNNVTVVPASSSNTASAIVVRDASSNIFVNQATCTALNSQDNVNTALTVNSNLASASGKTMTSSKFITPSVVGERKFVIWDSLNNDFQYFGFGVQSQTMVYNIGASTDSHVFYAGASSTTRNELIRIKGTGAIHKTSGDMQLTTTSGNISLAPGSTGTVSSSSDLVVVSGKKIMTNTINANGDILKIDGSLGVWLNTQGTTDTKIGGTSGQVSISSTDTTNINTTGGGITQVGNTTGTTNFAGGTMNVTAATAVNLSVPNVVASQVLVTDASNNLSSLRYVQSGTTGDMPSTIVQRDSNGFVYATQFTSNNGGATAIVTSTNGDVRLNAGTTAGTTHVVLNAGSTSGNVNLNPGTSGKVNANKQLVCAAGAQFTNATSGYVAGNLAWYEESQTASIAFSGPWTTTNYTWTFTRIGNVVTVRWPDMNGNSATTAAAISAPNASIPARFCPPSGSVVRCCVIGMDAGANKAGFVGLEWNSSGAISCYKDAASTQFSSSGRCGPYGSCWSYIV